MTMPPTHMIGAVISMVQVNCTSSWICWTSLVVRVSSDGAPNRAVSCCGEAGDVVEHRRPQVAAEAHAGAGAEVDRPDRAHHLKPGHREHHHAELDDGAGVALGDAVVDDRGVDCRQVQRGQRADDLQHRDRRDQPTVRPDILSQQRQEHLVTVAHRAARPSRRCPIPAARRSQQIGRSAACRWLTWWLPLQCMRVTRSRRAEQAMRRNSRAGRGGSRRGGAACRCSARARTPAAPADGAFEPDTPAAGHRQHGPFFPAVRRHQRPDDGRADAGDRPGQHGEELGRLPVAGRRRHPRARTSLSPGIAAARSGASARPRSCRAPASRTSTSRATAGSSRSATDPTLGDNLCEIGIQFDDDFIEWSISFAQKPFPTPATWPRN